MPSSVNQENPAGRKSKREPLPASALGSKIRKRRKELGISLVDLGKEVGLSNVAISDIETGKTNPDNPKTKGSIIEIAKALNSHFDEDWLRPIVDEKLPGVLPPQASQRQVPAGMLTDEQINSFSIEDVERYLRLHRKWLGHAESILAKRRRRESKQLTAR